MFGFIGLWDNLGFTFCGIGQVQTPVSATVYTTRHPKETPTVCSARSDFIPDAESMTAQTTDAVLTHSLN